MALSAEGVTKQYGGVTALRGASLSLLPGEVHALIGENGAGKSTLARIIAGVTQPDAARIQIDGRLVEIRNPRDAQRLGVGIIHQELDLFPSLTVGENITIGNLCYHGGSIDAFCAPFLAQVGLDCGVRCPVETLPIGHRQLLAIARALSMNARILLMDEPTSALFDDAVERLFGLIRDLKSRGVAVLYVSHKMDEIFRLCDRITVLRDGETVGTLDVAATTPREIVRMMVGRDVDTSERPVRKPSEEVVLHVENVRGVSFDLRRGEVLGIAGLVGSGRSELGWALYNLHPKRVGLLPEDRATEGLMPNMTVFENGTMGATRTKWGSFNGIGQRLALKFGSKNDPVNTLSGGNQQKVLFARWLLRDPDVLFLDDPARGIDVAAKQDIYRVIDDLAAVGKGVILTSSELPELLRCCDRILVLKNGRQTALYHAEEASPEKIMASATC